MGLGEGRQAFVLDAGQGPALLLLHGFLHSSWTWRYVIDAFRDRYRVIAPDLVGFGRSNVAGAAHDLPALRDWVESVLRALRISRLAGLVGNSLGGCLALQLALDLRERTGCLGLINPYLKALPLPSPAFSLLKKRPFAPLFRATAGHAGFRSRALSSIAFGGAMSPEELEGFAHLSREGSQVAACLTLRHLNRDLKALRKRLARQPLRQPTLLAWGQRDRLLGERSFRAAAKLLPQAQILRLETSGHCPQEEAPVQVIAALERLLARSD